jgi:hypothetical protein
MTTLLQISKPVLQPSTNDHLVADGELGRSALLHSTDPTAPRKNLARIDDLIQRTENRDRLKLLNRLWWKEWFRVYCGERKTA